jgi:Fe2+ transport system protein FeoA
MVTSLLASDGLVQQRLSELGFFVGRRLACVQKLPWRGPQLFHVGDSVFSLDFALAGLIEVELAEGI